MPHLLVCCADNAEAAHLLRAKDLPVIPDDDAEDNGEEAALGEDFFK
jgi:hypothetical protein